MLSDKESLVLLSLSESCTLESRNLEIYQEVGVDTEMAVSSLPLDIYLESTRKKYGFFLTNLPINLLSRHK